jgi:beta-glucosidase
VLLKNDGALLPLRKDVGQLAVIGALAEDTRAALGSWPGLGQPADAVSVLAGIRRAVSDKTKVTYARGAAATSGDRSGFDEAERAARAADVVIAVVGEIEDMSGEARSRSGLLIPGAQQALLERLIKTGKPIVVVLMNGRPLALTWLHEHAPAILESWFLGVEMGSGVADVLFGDVNPSGKLPISFPRNVGQMPLYYAHKSTGRPPSLTDPYSSRYLDVPWTPLYPFGHGLSYTQFKYDAPKLSAAKLGPTDRLQVTVRVQNVGQRTGTEVVQLYLRDEVGSITRPVQQLRGFQRVTLEPGAARELDFTLDQDDFALLDASFARVVEAGGFTVMVGGSSSDVQSAHFEITRSAKLPGLGSAIPRELRGKP